MDSTVTFLLLTSGQTQSSTSTDDETAQTDECHNPTQTTSDLQDQPASKKPSDPEVRSVGTSGEETATASTADQKFGPWTAEVCREMIQKHFDLDSVIHNCFLCNQKDCTHISKQEQQRIHPKKFQHLWLKRENWWLCYVEGEGMYCLICRKHHMKHPQNQAETFASTPSVRFKVDALKTHCSSEIHAEAQKTELLQKASYFHHQITKKDEVKDSVLEQAFSTAYFLMKSFIANRQFVPLLVFIEKIFDDSLKFFDHRSAGCQDEIFKLLGETVKTELLEKVKNAAAFGVLTDEVADISVTENLMTFIQFYDSDTKQVVTSFLSCQNVLSEFERANAEAIATLLLKELEENDSLDMTRFTGFTSDGASVMLGKKTGVAARLKQVNPVLLNVHCICHRLALACTDSNESLSYIKNLETWLRQLWQFFENSPQRMSAYLKIQTELKSIQLNRKTVKRVVKRLKKACRTRWLSLEAAVTAVKEDYEAILQTLSKFEKTDATAAGLLKKMRTLKFIGGIYILHSVLQVIGELSRRFQKGSFSFAAVLPAIHMTKDNLQSILEDETPIEDLRKDIDSFTDMCADIRLSQRDAIELQSLFRNYTTALINNIDRRFEDSSEVLTAFSIFDPDAMPNTTAELKVYGNQQLETLSHHYFKDNQDKIDRLKAQWHGMKYYIRDTVKPNMPKTLAETKTTPTEWLLLQLLNQSILKELYPDIMYIVEVVVSLPVSNAWPERGASTLKAIKNRLRNRLGTKMLESLLHISINAPDPCSEEGQKIVKLAVKSWLKRKPRRKLPKYRSTAIGKEAATPVIVMEDAGIQTEPVAVVDEEVFHTAVRAAAKSLNLEDYSEDEDENNEEDEDDYLWKEFEAE